MLNIHIFNSTTTIVFLFKTISQMKKSWLLRILQHLLTIVIPSINLFIVSIRTFDAETAFMIIETILGWAIEVA